MNRQCCHDRSGLTVKLCFAVWVFSLTVTIFAADIDWDKLQEKARQYQDKNAPQGTNVNLTLPSQPDGRIVDSSDPVLTDSDQRYITVHMKLANRHFLRKNYQRAIEEVELVFERQPNHPGGRFMRAVIAARMKEHATAWHNINIAREKDPDNPKIKSFVDKLKTVLPEPEKTVGVAGIFRPLPISASEKACDVIERLLKDPSSNNITGIEIEEPTSEGNSVWIPVKITCSSALQKSAIVAVLEKASSGRVEVASLTPSQSEEKLLDLKFELSGMTLENKDVKPISELREFVKLIAEEVDVAISDTAERDAENKVLETTYELAARDFKSLNDFLRKMSPYAHKFRVLSMKLAYVSGSQTIIWRCKVQIFYQLP